MNDDLSEELIYSYSRQQALDDGVLVDVTSMAKEAGFRYPVAMTRRAWEELVVPDQASRQAGQDENGRLWDVLNVLRFAIARSQGDTQIHFKVIFLFQGKEHKQEPLKAVCGPNDDLSPCITIMRPDED